MVKQGYKSNRNPEHGDDALDLVVNPLMAKMNSGTGGGDAESEELKELSDDLDSQLDGSKKKSDAVDDDDEIEFANNPLTKHNNLPPELAPPPGNFLPPPPLPDDTEAEALV